MKLIFSLGNGLAFALLAALTAYYSELSILFFFGSTFIFIFIATWFLLGICTVGSKKQRIK